MDSTNKEFSLVVIKDKQHGVLAVKEYEKEMQTAIDIASSYTVPEIIQDDATNKECKANRAKLNAAAKMVSDKRISEVRDFTSSFEEQMKKIEQVFQDKADEYKKPIDDYANRTPKPKIITITVKTYDPKVAETIEKFLDGKHIEYKEAK